MAQIPQILLVSRISSNVLLLGFFKLVELLCMEHYCYYC